MVGSINNGFQQQVPVFKSLNPGISSDKSSENTIGQNQKNNQGSPVSATQETESVGKPKQAQPVLQVGEDNGLSSRSADRGQNLDISV